MRYRVVETDNFGGDYPDEKFLPIPLMGLGDAQRVADAINQAVGEHASRYWKTVREDYVLQPGFEP